MTILWKMNVANAHCQNILTQLKICHKFGNMKDLTAGQITAWALAEMERRNCFVWRNNNLSVPGRKFIGMKGVPDIVGFVKNKGTAAYCEVKTSNDKFSEYQINFLNRAKMAGCLCYVATDDNGVLKLTEW